jgi:hypothetical protein
MISRVARLLVASAVCWSAVGCFTASAQESAAVGDRAATSAQASRGSDILDVVLGPAGELSGAVLDAQGQAVPHALVTLRQLGRPVASCPANGEGRFVLTGVRGGVFQIEAAGTMKVCRVWVADTQPPSARHEVLMVASGDVMRGQQLREARSVRWWITNPWVMATAVSAAIVVPIALTTDSKDAS